MFSVLISANSTAWETDQLMRMDASRFLEDSGEEATGISKEKPASLRVLETVPALLLYEKGVDGPNAKIVRFGYLRKISVGREDITFRFREEGRFPREVFEEFAGRLDVGRFALIHTHWAVKDGGIPKAMMAKLKASYDVVLSFAGENREYVEKVADYLRDEGVRVFYDEYEAADLWGKNLAEHFEFIYGDSSQYCVMFISKPYAEKMWTRHERRSAVVRALKEHEEYILPVRFDETRLPGISPAVGYVSAIDKTPRHLGELILRKLGRTGGNAKDLELKR